jgi:hypothetical protein
MFSYGKSDVEVAVEINRHRLHVNASSIPQPLYSLTSFSVKVLIDIDYYKNRMQILALRPAPIQVDIRLLLNLMPCCRSWPVFCSSEYDF